MTQEAEVMIKEEKIVGQPSLMMMILPFACAGCQNQTVSRIIAETLVELGVDGKAVSIIGVGCAGSLVLSMNVDRTMSAHGRPPDLATAVKRLRPDTFVFTVQGDGDCMAIGAGPFIAALTRGEKISIIMCNNTCYGTTGGQLAPTTVMGEVTATTPDGRQPSTEGYPAHTAELAALFKGTAYSARGAVNTPANYQRTRTYIKTAFEKQINNVGLSFVEVLIACPVNWRMSPVDCLKWIDTEMIPEFPLGEFKNVGRIE